MNTEGYKRKISAILSIDAAGYSRLMGGDEDATVRTLTAYRTIMSALIRKHRGRVVDAVGDNLLAEFGSVVDAVGCARVIQAELRRQNSELPEDRRMHFRIGINLGDVINDGDSIYGDGVNVAARLEGLAEAGGITLSGTAYDQVKHKLPYRFEYQGTKPVKHIQDPVRVYRMDMRPVSTASPYRAKPIKSKRSRVLRSVLGLALGAVLAAGLIIWGRMHIRALENSAPSIDFSGPISKKASIAVLPFRNLGREPEQAYFSDGMARDIITDLSKFRNLFVISSNTSFAFKDKPLNAQMIGDQLGVRYIVAGSVQKSGNRVRINAELVEASSGTHVWGERYDRAYEDVFDLQSEIVQAIVAMLAIKISKTEQARARGKQPQNLEAYDYLLRGQELYYRYARNSNNMAAEMFARAIELDPDYAAAYTGLGWVYQAKVAYGWSAFPDKALQSAYRYGRKALALDGSDASAHALLCGVYVFQNQYDRAIAEAQWAIDLNPNDAVAYLELGWVLLWSGRVDEAISALERSLRLDSVSPLNGWWHLGMAYYLKGRYRDAVVVMEQGVTRKSGFNGYYIGLAAAYARLGQTDNALKAADELRRLDPFFRVDSFGTGFRDSADRQAILEGLRLAGLK